MIKFEAPLAPVAEGSACILIEDAVIAVVGTRLTLGGHHGGGLGLGTLRALVLLAEIHIIRVQVLHILSARAVRVAVTKAIAFDGSEILLACQTLIWPETCHASDWTQLALSFAIKIFTSGAIVNLLLP